jgi:hypothetical protein
MKGVLNMDNAMSSGDKDQKSHNVVTRDEVLDVLWAVSDRHPDRHCRAEILGERHVRFIVAMPGSMFDDRTRSLNDRVK